VTVDAQSPRRCRNCRFWSQWLESTGDCLEYAHRRREQLLARVALREVLPAKPARCTDENDTCEKWQSVPEADHGR